ncbi:Fur family transcriptional regulator [Modestobacter versicolor]|uniref:Fur family ferric uptake transcriptional regulator n=1 Tax=Modestobacter versicolor TaxID=429133 RepID=A0A323VVV4_9ACTN|nr:Fur family transcriptional regulator [Modestobacter versicolor]MBB3674892.1 Fur family ferric uptake transcriptional regulator [Modestobacter versicolor]PZA22928.1 transcriptional repressor [Modestobacter versicolor]
METAWDEQLRHAGLRVTRPRLSVLGVLAQHPHVDADTIATAARTVHPSISPQAVYGVLKALVGGGLARRIEPAGGPALYELRVGDNHHHLVCRECGSVADVDCVVGAAPCLAPSDAAGFEVDEAEVVFWGLCGDCQVARRKHGNQHQQ